MKERHWKQSQVYETVYMSEYKVLHFPNEIKNILFYLLTWVNL